MKKVFTVLIFLVCSTAFANKCIYQADAAAQKIMRLNGETIDSTEVGNIRHVFDGVNTDYFTYDIVGLSEAGKESTLTYRVSIDYNNSCKILNLSILGGN